MNEPAVDYTGERSCEGCTMCCKLLSIEALNKPRLQWCTHCDIGVGCKIYEERPPECRTFYCGYLAEPGIGEHWKPTKSKMVVSRATNANRIVIYVDADRSDAWRREPYYSDIKNWARAATKSQGQILVSQGRDMIVVLPDGEANLGPVRDDQVIIARRKRGAGSTGFDHFVVDQDDPILGQMTLLKDTDASKNTSPDKRAEAKRQVDAWLTQQDK
jgi:hypothetical protein